MKSLMQTMCLGLLAVSLTLSPAGAARAEDEDAAFTDVPDVPDVAAPAPAPAPATAAPVSVAEQEADAFGMGEVEAAWGPAIATVGAGKFRLGVRGGFLFPATDYDYGPTAGIFVQRGISNKFKIEFELSHAQLASSNEAVNTSLWLGSAGAQFILASMSKMDIYLQADIGAISEEAASASQATDSMLSTIGFSVGMVASNVADFRIGVSMLTNSDNVESLSSFKFGLLY